MRGILRSQAGSRPWRAIAASFVILSSPPVLQRLVGGDTRAYVLATVALALVHAALA